MHLIYMDKSYIHTNLRKYAAQCKYQYLPPYFQNIEIRRRFTNRCWQVTKFTSKELEDIQRCRSKMQM